MELSAELVDPQTGDVRWRRALREGIDVRDAKGMRALVDRALEGAPLGQRGASKPQPEARSRPVRAAAEPSACTRRASRAGRTSTATSDQAKSVESPRAKGYNCPSAPRPPRPAPGVARWPNCAPMPDENLPPTPPADRPPRRRRRPTGTAASPSRTSSSKSYLDYSMSVIIGRALPDVRDGLKPVHRRMLYAMHTEGLHHNKRYSKCAGVVGEVLKKYHPHGDASVYDALVRLAQEWNLRYPLIDGQGNFGSVDGDPAAAYRYTECRLEKLADWLLADIDKDTVEWSPNFDDSTARAARSSRRASRTCS